MSRHATAASLPLPFEPTPPASAPRLATGPFAWTHRGAAVEVLVQRRDGLGVWPTGEPSMVPADPGAVERAMQRRALRVEGEMRGGKRERAKPVVDARGVRALLLERGALDHHELAEALGGTAAEAAHVLTHLRNSGHVHRADTRTRPRTKAGDVGGPHSMGVWELTVQGRAATKRELKSGGKRLTTYNDAGYRSSGAT